MKKLIFSEEIWREEDMYTSYCRELDIASCGHTPDEAKKNLSEAIGIFIEETSKMGTLKELLEEAGYQIEGGELIFLKREEIVGLGSIDLPVGAI
jgi:predicted RNase H-like HicB family nuclease